MSLASAADTDQVVLDENLGPQYVVLATDGRPNDNCEGGVGGDAMPQVVAAAQLGAAKGIKMFVISLAEDPGLQAHLAEVAEIGMPGQVPFTPTSKDELTNLLTQLVGGAVGCEVILNGTVITGSECTGFVEVNGIKLPCADDNGWRLKSPNTIELTGQACLDFMNDPTALLRADFPCEVFIPE